MSTLTTIAALAALALTAEKQTWSETQKPQLRAEILPRSAVVEVDGKQVGRGFVSLDVNQPDRTFKVRISAEGFETEEAMVTASKAVNRPVFLALRPAGFAKPVAPEDASSMALAASALLKAGRLDDAVDYAEQSLRTGNTPLANRVLGDVWRQRGDRDQAVRYYTMYLSIADDPKDGPEIRAWLLQDKPGDITVPAN